MKVEGDRRVERMPGASASSSPRPPSASCLCKPSLSSLCHVAEEELDAPAPVGLSASLPPRRQLSSVSPSRELSIPRSPSLRHRIDPMVLRSLSLPPFQKLKSLSGQKSDVFVIRSLSISGLQDFNDDCTQIDPHQDEKEVSEDEAVCRICMLELDEGKETFKMECSCKGDLALAHKDCAIKWFSVKGNNLCDICNSTVCNLPVLLFRRASSLLHDNLSAPEDDNIQENSSWRHAAAILLSSALASLWQKLEELSEFP